MFSFFSLHVTQRHILSLVGALLILSGASLAASQDLIQPDGRLNQIAHFGGDALYCVDSNYTVTKVFPVTGGFRLLDSNGQELWFVPAADINAAVEESVATDSRVRIAEGQGTYGATSLYTYFDGSAQVFEFNGLDEFGKMNTLKFSDCFPVGPSAGNPDSKTNDPLCTLITYNVPGKRLHNKQVTPVFDPGPEPITEQVPCDTCPTMPPPPPPPKRFVYGKQPVFINSLPPDQCLEFPFEDN